MEDGEDANHQMCLKYSGRPVTCEGVYFFYNDLSNTHFVALRVQKEESEANLNVHTSVCENISSVEEDEREDKENRVSNVVQDSKEGCIPYPSSSPGLILMELKPAKFNLNRTTSDIADVRASVESLSKKLEKERLSLEKTRERLAQNSSKICSLEEELNQQN
ncbi:hypothetical protein JHK85_006424 [Glycine max]|nr:hypothetical protein JHK85_006424 [Glycine max]